MDTWVSVEKLALGFTALLLLVSCSSNPVGGNDIESKTEVFDSFGDAAGADGMVADGVDDAGDATVDVPSDAFVCGDVPKEGCPCNDLTDKPCCLMVGQGLSCEAAHFIDEGLIFEWGVFWDCGCMEGPPCDGEDFYGLCPGQ